MSHLLVPLGYLACMSALHLAARVPNCSTLPPCATHAVWPLRGSQAAVSSLTMLVIRLCTLQHLFDSSLLCIAKVHALGFGTKL